MITRLGGHAAADRCIDDAVQRFGLPAALGVLIMPIDIFHADHDRARVLRCNRLGRPDYNCAIADVQLCTTISNSEAKGELESVAEPVNGLVNIRVTEHGITVQSGMERFLSIFAGPPSGIKAKEKSVLEPLVFLGSH